MRDFAQALITDIDLNLSLGKINEARTIVGVLLGVAASASPKSAHVLYEQVQFIAKMDTIQELIATKDNLVNYLP